MEINKDTDALIMVDVQNDFCPGGSLAVPEGDQVVQPLNKLKKLFSAAKVIATRDWHPRNTRHFQERGGKWPPHCVNGTKGAEFHPDLDTEFTVVVSKGMDAENDAGYSGFEGTTVTGLTLDEYLSEKGVQRVFVGGLATDYCVKATVLDALQKGYEVAVVTDAIRAVNINPGDGEKAIKEMTEAGAVFVTSDEVVSS